jgi:transcription initiation factor TFIIF subunit beta
MAASDGAVVPTVKVEHVSSPQIKEEAPDNIASPYLDEEDVYEDAGDLDFSNAQQELWLSRIPKSLWQIWSNMPEDGEIEIGTIRVEGDTNDPKRVRRPMLRSICGC